VSQGEAARIRNSGLQLLILNSDLASFYNARLRSGARTPFAAANMGGFYTFSGVLQKLNDLRRKYKGLISEPVSIGTSIEGRPIVAVKISDNVDADELDEPEALYTALHHSREPESLMCVMYFIEKLLEGYHRDPEITYIVDHRQLWFVPVVNPDGYVYNEQTNPGGGGLWRKNRRDNGDGTVGVDLNRNYGYKWAFDDLGSSPFGEDEAFRGAAPFSEPETQALRDFVTQRRFGTTLNYHSYKNAILYPWSYQSGGSPQQAVFRDLSHYMSRINEYATGTSWQILQYTANGEATDWLYAPLRDKQRIFSMTSEVGTKEDGFWPAPDRMLPLARENYASNLSLAWMAGGYPVVQAWRVEAYPGGGTTGIQPGGAYRLFLTLRNLGTGASVRGVTVRLKSPTSGATVASETASFGTMDPLRIRTRSSQLVRISLRVTTGQKVPLVLWIESNGVVLRKENITLTIGGNPS
ncbi:MAG TPA: M14 family metallopeptidase, partial [Acidobacteriota bacterium]|nr:M14 family metallopeptidase [Acidobacteriota bacterium]